MPGDDADLDELDVLDLTVGAVCGPAAISRTGCERDRKSIVGGLFQLEYALPLPRSGPARVSRLGPAYEDQIGWFSRPYGRDTAALRIRPAWVKNGAATKLPPQGDFSFRSRDLARLNFQSWTQDRADQTLIWSIATATNGYCSCSGRTVFGSHASAVAPRRRCPLLRRQHARTRCATRPLRRSHRADHRQIVSRGVV